MKTRFARNRQSGARELVVLLRRNDAVSSRRLRWLLSSPHKGILHFRYAFGARRGKTRLYYDVSGLTSLRGFLRRTKLTTDGLTRMLVSLAEALMWCSGGGNRFASMLFDPAHVFVGTTCELHFVFLPVAETSGLEPNTPLALLEALGDVERLHFLTPNAADLSRHLADFVLGEDGVFSLNAFKAFLRSACKVEVRQGGAVARPHEAGRLLRHVSTGRTYELDEGVTLRMGRGSGCDVRLSDNADISREHAYACCEGGEVFVWDAGSKNGTSYNGVRLGPGERVRVSPGETFLLDAEAFEVA